MSAHITGIEEMKTTFGKVVERSRKAACAAVYLEANNIMRDTIPATPKRTGTARSSAYVTVPEDEPLVEFGFGGPCKDYIVIIHEKLFKNYTTDGTGPKFLEMTVNAYRRVLDRDVSALYRAAFERNKGPDTRGRFASTPEAGAAAFTATVTKRAQTKAQNAKRRAGRRAAGAAIRKSFEKRGGK